MEATKVSRLNRNPPSVPISHDTGNVALWPGQAGHLRAERSRKWLVTAIALNVLCWLGIAYLVVQLA